MRSIKIIFTSLVFALGLYATTGYSESFTGGQPASPQPDPAQVKPGLWVMYFYDFHDHIDEVSEKTSGTVGKPLTHIEHLASETEKVLTADTAKGVGAHIRGYIHLEQAGKYTFRLQSNDGVRLHIGGVKLWTDPEIHAARWSRPLEYEVVEPGWYEFKLDYYQRKGTSALKLVWTLPGASEEVVVPPEAYVFNP